MFARLFEIQRGKNSEDGQNAYNVYKYENNPQHWSLQILRFPTIQEDFLRSNFDTLLDRWIGTQENSYLYLIKIRFSDNRT